MYSLISHMRVGRQLLLLQAILLLFLVLIGVLGIRGMAHTIDKLEYLDHKVLMPIEKLTDARTTLVQINVELLRAFQHQPGHALVALHNHPAALHLDRADGLVQSHEDSWRAFASVPQEEAEIRAEITQFQDLHGKSAPIVASTLQALRAEDYSFAVQRAFIVDGQQLMRDQIAVLDKPRSRRMQGSRATLVPG